MLSRSIGARLAAAYLLPSLLGLGALGVWVDGLARSALEEELGRKVVAVAAAAAATVPAERLAYLQPGDEETRTYGHFRERLEELRAATGARRLVLFTPDERALVDAGGAAKIGDPLPELARDRLELETVLAGTPQASQVLFEASGQLFKTGYAPVKLDGAVVGAVLAEGSAAHFSALREFRASLVLLGLLAALTVVLVAFHFSRTLAVPIRSLVASAERIGGGDLQTPVAGRESRDELGELARRLEEMRARLLARERELQLMLAGIAHEVRNPLGGMELYAGLLAEDLADDEPKLALLRRIRREIEQLARLVTDFLEFARDKPLEPADTDARALLVEVGSLLAAAAEARQVRVSIEGEASLRCDAGAVRRALLNLAQNAVQASPAGGEVTLSVSAADGAVRFSVRDRGPGLSADAAARAFEPFFTTKEKGTGLGLALVGKTAASHGGSVRHEPTPGGGATFVLTLPARVASHGPAAMTPAPAPNEAPR